MTAHDGEDGTGTAVAWQLREKKDPRNAGARLLAQTSAAV
jgi:hypothetical protein